MKEVSFKGTFAGIPSLEKLDPRAVVLDAAQGYDDQDDYFQEHHMLVDDVIGDTTVEEVLAWYSIDPYPNTEYIDRYVAETWGEKPPPTPAMDFLYGGLWMALDDLLVSTFDELKEEELLPWQLPECFYCNEHFPDLKKDRINQLACKKCWDEGVDGPW